MGAGCGAPTCPLTGGSELSSLLPPANGCLWPLLLPPAPRPLLLPILLAGQLWSSCLSAGGPRPVLGFAGWSVGLRISPRWGRRLPLALAVSFLAKISWVWDSWVIREGVKNFTAWFVLSFSFRPVYQFSCWNTFNLHNFQFYHLEIISWMGHRSSIHFNIFLKSFICRVCQSWPVAYTCWDAFEKFGIMATFSIKTD